LNEEIETEEIARRLKQEYRDASDDLDFKKLESIHKLILGFQKKPFNPNNVLKEIAQLIYRNLSIREVNIGTKDPGDGLFKYRAFAGLRKSTEIALKALVYTEKEFFDPIIYPGTSISNHTTLFFAEDNPYAEGEEETVNRPVMLKARRISIEESIEGDYFNTYILGPREDVIGWIEISGTKSWRFPDVLTIKFIEMLSSIAGVAILIEGRSDTKKQYLRK